MLNFILGLFSFDLGIDLGTANTLVYVSGKGIAVREPSVVARNKKTREILAIGSAAAKMRGKTSNTIEVFRPLKGGVIADFHGASALISYYIGKVHETGSVIPKIPRPRVVIGIPSSVTEVERRAVIEVAYKAGARRVYLVPEAIAASVGANLKIMDEVAQGVIDIGGGTTDIAFIAGGRIATGTSVRVAGDAMDERLIEYIKLKYSLLVGYPTAEQTKMLLADTTPAKEHFQVIRGRDLESGFPKSVRISNFEVNDALIPVFNEIAAHVVRLIEEAPPELVSDISKTGIVITGGGALIRNIAPFLEKKTHIEVRVADDPLTSVVRGCGKLLSDMPLLRVVEYKAEKTIR